MEELHPTPAAEPAEPAEPAAVTPAAQPDQPAPPRDCWADLAPGALSRDHQALLAAWMAGRAMPRRTLVRRIIGAAALFGLLACFVNACRMLLDQEQASPLQFFCPLVFAFLFLLALKDFPLRLLLRRALGRLRDGTLYPDRLHLVTARGEADLAVEDIIMVQRFVGWTVLIWGSWKHQRIVPIPDDACFGEGPRLYGRLQEQVEDARFFRSARPPRRRRHLVVGLLSLAVVLCTQVVLLPSYWGFRSYTLTAPDGSGSVEVNYLGLTQAFSSDSVGNFAFPSTGEFHAQWSGSGCCVVTYRATDGSLRVQMLEPAPGAAQRLAMDPPKGSWTTFLDSDDSYTLDWDAALPGYRLKTPWGTLDCPQREQFDGMGLALCDKDGLPRWTLTPTDIPATNSDGSPVNLPGLLLCPVSLTSSDTDVLLLGPADSPFLPG